MSDFVITSGKGFHITFPNGWTVSTQFGAGNYSDNYDAHSIGIIENYDEIQRQCGAKGSRTAEVWCWPKDKYGPRPDWANDPEQLNPAEWLEYVNKVAAL